MGKAYSLPATGCLNRTYFETNEDKSFTSEVLVTFFDLSYFPRLRGVCCFGYGLFKTYFLD